MSADGKSAPPQLEQFDFARQRELRRLRGRVTGWCLAWLPVQAGWATCCLSLVLLLHGRVPGWVALGGAVVLLIIGAQGLHEGFCRQIQTLEDECERLAREHRALVYGSARRAGRKKAD